MAHENSSAPRVPDGARHHVPSAAEIKRRRSRSIALALVLGALVILFYFVTIAKMGPQILERTM